MRSLVENPFSSNHKLDGTELTGPYAECRALRGFLSRASNGTWPPIWEGAASYYANDELRKMLWYAITLQRPLLLTGAPGHGKTSAAYWAALMWALRDGDTPREPSELLGHYQTRSTSTAQELKYDYDSVRRFRDYQHGSTKQPTTDRDPGSPNAEWRQYLIPRPLYYAFDIPAEETVRSKKYVVLIDEIDKAARDFPNDLLYELDQLEFEVPESRVPAGDAEPGRDAFVVGRRTQGQRRNRLLVVLTSNGDRELPEPFLRRCLSYRLELSGEDVSAALRQRFRLSGASKQKPEDESSFEAWLKRIDDVEGELSSTDEDSRWLGISLTRKIDWLRMMELTTAGTPPTRLSATPHLELLLAPDDLTRVRAGHPRS